MSYRTYENLIGGQWQPAVSGKTILNLNPADRADVVGAFPSSHPEDMELAVAAAKKAFESWRLVPAPKRAEILLRTAHLLEVRKEEYARAMTREMGKVLAETRGDVQESIDEAYYAAGEGRRLFGVTTPSELPDKFAMSVRAPLGVVGLITPWNFPMAIPAWKLFPALVAGNTCVIKPASDTPLSTYNLVHALMDAGLPPGVVNIVAGNGQSVGMSLVEHKDVRAISFTGSSGTGAQVAERAARTFKAVSLQMGGKNAQIVVDDADVDLAVEGALWGAFGTSGQRCTATSRILLQKGIAAEFTRKFVERAKKLKVGNGLDESVDMGPMINPKQVENAESYVVIAYQEGAELLYGGHALDEGSYAHGSYFEPTVFGGVTAAMRIAREEIFAPLAALMEFESFEDAVKIANGVEYGLSTAIYTRDVNRVFEAMRDLEAGLVYINAPTIGAEVHLPFGGVKQTGNGNREGLGTLEFFSTPKTVFVDYSGRLQRAQIDGRR
ncbi:MAG: aldehyde dehydrogenase family protein [Terracidiphilus sp.]|nr:aldehyde dehydrogenase family protein [Terracidiphilus sp.]